MASDTDANSAIAISQPQAAPLEPLAANLQRLVDEAVADRRRQIDEKERELGEREARLLHLQKATTVDNQRPITLRVGQHVFHTTAAVLCSHAEPDKESFFATLLASRQKLTEQTEDGLKDKPTRRFSLFRRSKKSSKQKHKEQPTPGKTPGEGGSDASNNLSGETRDKSDYFIPRDGEVFQFVLEYLTYGRLVSDPDLSALRKLQLDAEYYVLPQLCSEVSYKIFAKEQEHMFRTESLAAQKGEDHKPLVIGKWASSLGPAKDGGFWQWNVEEIRPPPAYFMLLPDPSNNKDCSTVIINKAGVYQISARVSGYTLNQQGGYMAIKVNGSNVALSHMGPTEKNYASWQLDEAFVFKANDKVQVFHYYAGGSYGNPASNKLTIRAL